MGLSGFLHIVRCKICSKIEHKDKFLAPKWDSLQKHVDQKIADKPMKRVKKGEWYPNNDCKHSRNQATYASKGKIYIFATSF